MSPARRHFDVPALAATAFLASSAMLNLVAQLTPGYIAATARGPLTVVGVSCLLVSVGIAAVGRLHPMAAAGVILGGDVCIMVSATSPADVAHGQLIGILFALPTLFVAVFLNARWLLGQSAVTTSGMVYLSLRAGQEPSVVMLHTLLMLVAAACPAVVVVVLRAQLDRSVALAHDLATRDPLTGLANRRGLREAVPQLLARAHRLNLPVGVLIADLDHFKQVNDRFGHAVGDDVLVAFAGAVAGSVRGEDVVARLGGEEVAVVAAIGPDDLAQLAERLRARVARDGATWSVTVSVGMAWDAVEPVSGTDPAAEAEAERRLAALMDRADEAMYDAKRSGRDRVCVAAAG